MAVYTVHAPPSKAGQTRDDPERFVFVRDGFHFWAFLLTPLWLLVNRLWLVLLGYLAITFAVGAALRAAGASGAVEFLLGLLIALLVGLEAGTLRRWTLARRRWRVVGTVVGDDVETAEHRFFAAWVAREPADAAPISAVPTVTSVTAGRAPRPAQPPGIVGLFPEPGGRA